MWEIHYLQYIHKSNKTLLGRFFVIANSQRRCTIHPWPYINRWEEEKVITLWEVVRKQKIWKNKKNILIKTSTHFGFNKVINCKVYDDDSHCVESFHYVYTDRELLCREFYSSKQISQKLSILLCSKEYELQCFNQVCIHHWRYPNRCKHFSFWMDVLFLILSSWIPFSFQKKKS